MAAAIAAVCFGIAFVLPAWAAVIIGLAVLVALVAIDTLRIVPIDGLELARDAMTVVRQGNSATVTLSVTNTGATPISGELWEDWPDSVRQSIRHHRFALAPNTVVRMRTTVTPSQRGDRDAGPITIRSFGPLGLVGWQFTRDVPATVRALPPFHSERRLRSKVKLLQHLEGRSLTDIRGAGSEFDSYREYVVGDDVRAIDWRATARSNDVIVKTWRPERNRSVLLLLDTGRTSAALVGEGTRLDASIEAALLLGGIAAEAGDTVSLLAFDREIRAEVRGTSGSRLQSRLMHGLSSVVPRQVDTDCAAMVRAAITRTPRRGLVVWFTALDGAMVEENLLPALPPLLNRQRVMFVSVADPAIADAAAERGSLTDIYTAAAAESVLAERALVQTTLRRKGAKVGSARPELLAAALADEYLDLKQTAQM